MALPPKFVSPSSNDNSYPMPKIPSPAGPSAGGSKAGPGAAAGNANGSQATDWNTTNAIRNQQLQTKHGLSASDAKKLTSNNNNDDDNDNND